MFISIIINCIQYSYLLKTQITKMKTCSYMKLNGEMCGKNCYYELCRTHKNNAILTKCSECNRYTQSKTGKCHCTRKKQTPLIKERDEYIIGFALQKIMK